MEYNGLCACFQGTTKPLLGTKFFGFALFVHEYSFKNNYRANLIRLCKTLRMKIVETKLGGEICMSTICQTVKHYTKFLVMFVSYKSFHFLSYLWR